MLSMIFENTRSLAFRAYPNCLPARSYVHGACANQRGQRRMRKGLAHPHVVSQVGDIYSGSLRNRTSAATNGPK
jgi:hypothetical protein